MRLLLAPLLAVSLAAPAACAPSDKAVWTTKDDPAMDAAVANARRTLPQFWSTIEARPAGVTDASVKVGYPTAHGGVEYLWIYVEDRQPTQVRGEIANEPEDVPGVHAGQHVTIDAAKIADWTYARGGLYYGQYTTRVVLQHVDEKSRQEEGARLAPTPLEPEVH